MKFYSIQDDEEIPAGGNLIYLESFDKYYVTDANLEPNQEYEFVSGGIRFGKVLCIGKFDQLS